MRHEVVYVARATSVLTDARLTDLIQKELWPDGTRKSVFSSV